MSFFDLSSFACSIEFTKLKKGSRGGKQQLLTSQGYSYVVNKQNIVATYWRCSKRKCPSTVIERDGIYTTNRAHCHDPDETVLATRLVLSKVCSYRLK